MVPPASAALVRHGAPLAGADTIGECVDRLFDAVRWREADLIFVVPPFASPDWPSLGVHILADLAQSRGVSTCVLYANLSFARLVGPNLYRELCVTRTGDMAGERLFRLAYNKTRTHPGKPPHCWQELAGGAAPGFEDVQALATLWADAFALRLAAAPARHIGFSTTFEQTLASLSLITRLKALAPDRVTLLGGANADGPMGAAIQAFEPAVDHVFVGESEASFLRFIDETVVGGRPAPALFQGENNNALNDLAPTNYASFFAQFEALVRAPDCPDGLDSSELRIPYETSRGCWWGAKHHCTFCGLNANGMNHRIKDPAKVESEIHALSTQYNVDKIIMVDNIMPHSYFSTLLPALTEHEKKLNIFYEQKANISREKMKLLADAGVRSIQPGIESLSTGLLKRMQKGASAQTNIDCMRHARACGVDIVWNVLADFPGDSAEDYDAMLAIMAHVCHLAPPTGVSTISLDRFSPYHSEPGQHAITDLRPIDVYGELFPGADLQQIAYHFTGDYDSALRREPELLEALEAEVAAWRKLWEDGAPPVFSLFELGEDRFLVADTRPMAVRDAEIVNRAQAHTILNGAKDMDAQVRQALDLNYLAPVDGRFGAVCCAEPSSAAW